MIIPTMWTTAFPWLLAASSRRIGKAYRPEEALISHQHFMLLIVVLLLVTIGSWMIATWLQKRREQPHDSPRGLFRELCRAHGLSTSQQHLLHQIAEWHKLANPNQLFLERELFQSPALVSDLGNREFIEDLRDILFDQTPEEATPGNDAEETSIISRLRRLFS